MGNLILTGLSQGKHKFSLSYQEVNQKTICIATCKCGYQIEILHFTNYAGVKDLQQKWEAHILTQKN